MTETHHSSLRQNNHPKSKSLINLHFLQHYNSIYQSNITCVSALITYKKIYYKQILRGFLILYCFFFFFFRLLLSSHLFNNLPSLFFNMTSLLFKLFPHFFAQPEHLCSGPHSFWFCNMMFLCHFQWSRW